MPADQPTTLTRTIGHEEEGRYLEVPFLVPDGTETLSVRFEVDPGDEAGAVVDLGVRDPRRARGWSGGARTEFFISPTRATPGYLPGELTPGEWAVLLGAYRIPKDGCAVRITIRVEAAESRWLKGDLHAHSVHSDGAYDLPEAARLARDAGLEFLALTDHNTPTQNFAYPRESDLTFIPGMEFTTYQGHANLLGVADPLEDFRATTTDEVRERLRQARRKGARIVLNHPYDGDLGWQWGWDVDHDWVEVWNGPWRPCNERALEWWQSRLASGKRVVAVGGSDTHRPDPYVRHGMPTNCVYSPGRSVPEILDAICRGHIFLSYLPDGPSIDLTCGPHIMGDVVAERNHDNQDIRLRADRVSPGDIVRVVSDGGMEEEHTVQDGGGSFELSWPAGDRLFYRVEVWRHFTEVSQTLMAAMSNPIYLASRQG